MKAFVNNKYYNGILMAGGSYTIWGILPIYWKYLETIPALQILAHRIVWSVFFLWVLMLFQGKIKNFLREIKGLLGRPRILLGVFTAGVILNLNWGTYIWAVNHNHIVQTSLGYYINPLISVMLGIIFLKERLSLWQLLAFLLATIGVLSLTLQYGTFPWVALILALSFGFYGLFKKLTSLDSITGLTLETMLTCIFALAYLIYLRAANLGSFHFSLSAQSGLLFGAGIVTAVPLLLFGAGAHRLPLFVLGFLQYINPTMTLLLGTLLYHEPFTRGHLLSFGLIWIALIVFSLSKTRMLSQMEERILSRSQKKADLTRPG
ncbi:MAG: EamA family transporter RarD [Syntrophomonadaceae bacterium]|jgi:chloramphenicol-sensitive protein RarD|nr:EamA family transporter RarD [Syntrophomonadaceae bacterium]